MDRNPRVQTVVVAILLAGALCVGVTAVAANSTVFTYASSDEPGDTTSTVTNSTYQHSVAVETNATTAPIVLTVFYNQSADIAYESHNATLNGTPLTMQVTTSNVTVNGRNLTRAQFVNRSISTTGTETLRLTANLSMPTEEQQQPIYTGGTHAPSGTTLPRRTTNVQVKGRDLTPTDIAVDPDPPGVNESTKITTNIANIGSLDATSVPVNLSVNGSTTDSRTATVQAGSSSQVTFDWKPSTTGVRQLQINVDPQNTVSELTTANNTVSLTTTVEDFTLSSENVSVVNNSKAEASLSSGGVGTTALNFSEPVNGSVDMKTKDRTGTPGGADQLQTQIGGVDKVVANLSIETGGLNKSDVTATTTVTVDVPSDVSASSLTVTRFNDTTNQWETLSTTLVSTSGSSATLRFTTHFTVFAISGETQEQNQNQNQNQNEEEESSGGGGGGGGGSLGPPERQIYPGVTDSPDGTFETDITDQDSLTPGKTLEFTRIDKLSVLERVTLLTDEPGSEDSLTIREYRSPPEDIAADLSSDLGLERVGVADAVEIAIGWRTIEVRREIPDQVSSTVTLSVARSDINKPESAFIAYRTQDGSWERANTQVTERTDQQVALKATIESTSVVAVGEPREAQTSGEPSSEETPQSSSTPKETATVTPSPTGTVMADTQTPSPSAETPGSDGPGFGGALAVLAVFVAALIAIREPV